MAESFKIDQECYHCSRITVVFRKRTASFDGYLCSFCIECVYCIDDGQEFAFIQWLDKHLYRNISSGRADLLHPNKYVREYMKEFYSDE